jgi:hypothetical protein
MEISMEELIFMGLLMSVAALAIMSAISFGLIYVVALRSIPDRRAAWTAGVSYLIVTIFMIFGGVRGYEIYAPFTGLPAAVIIYFYWRWEFRKSWVDSADELTDGLVLANDDWKVGLIFVIGALVAAAIKSLMRQGI